MKKLHLLVSLILSVIMVSFFHENYSDIMKEKVEIPLGEDFRDFHFFSYTTDNFGVIRAILMLRN
ncbi:MAG: hypothetical protein MH321_06080 [Leptospiraceae bacterium]|nr:hypothetical protein [Leptospiraceae bacterium]